MNAVSLILFAVLTGAFFGFLFSAVWLKVSPKGTSKNYYSDLFESLQIIFQADKFSDLMREYSRMLKGLGLYLGKTLLALVLALLPFLLFYFSLYPKLFSAYEQKLEGYFCSSEKIRVQEIKGQLQYQMLGVEKVIAHELPLPLRPVAICEDEIQQGVYSMLGYQTFKGDSYLGTVAPFTIRKGQDEVNPCWPWLNDLEFALYLSLCVASVAGFVFAGKKTKREKAILGDFDFALSRFAANHRRRMVHWGNKETARNRKELGSTQINSPIYVCGLARSGTTILLESLFEAQGIATHRYRDYPFVMTPLWWHRFTEFFARKQEPSERPHQDGIQITRESPDAFEEPIWMSFFDQIHEWGHSHVLNEKCANPDFDAFYSDHIKKILLLRKGHRYLSKGNYNVLRLEYLHRLFPDACFVVPVRHPLAHVHSLVRQHKLFCDYAKSDPRIPEYLTHVGHFEFGPQRIPSIVSGEQSRQIRLAFEQGEDYLGYALQWSAIYEYIHRLKHSDKLIASRIRIVRYEDFCSDPEETYRSLLDFCHLSAPEGVIAKKKIRSSSHQHPDLPQDILSVIRPILQPAGRLFDYKV